MNEDYELWFLSNNAEVQYAAFSHPNSVLKIEFFLYENLAMEECRS